MRDRRKQLNKASYIHAGDGAHFAPRIQPAELASLLVEADEKLRGMGKDLVVLSRENDPNLPPNPVFRSQKSSNNYICPRDRTERKRKPRSSMNQETLPLARTEEFLRQPFGALTAGSTEAETGEEEERKEEQLSRKRSEEERKECKRSRYKRCFPRLHLNGAA